MIYKVLAALVELIEAPSAETAKVYLTRRLEKAGFAPSRARCRRTRRSSRCRRSSGARRTCTEAAALGRHLMAVPGPVTSAVSVGCHALLRTREAECVTSAPDVLELVSRLGDDVAPEPASPGLDSEPAG